MRAGLLRQSITIMAPATTKDALGQLLPSTGTPVLSTRASIKSITGKEVYALGSGFTSEVSHMIVLRYPVGIAIRANMTITFGTRQFLIQYPFDPDERQRELHLVCLEINQ